MPAQFIYTMQNLSRFYPPDREVLRGINLSFYPGAKIGVIGSNGSGKSTLLAIMAGLDDDYQGSTRLTPGFSVGYLSQNPHLDPDKDVRSVIQEGVGEAHSLLQEFEELGARLGEMGPEEMEQALIRYGEVQDRIEAIGAWEIERQLEVASDALRLPPADAMVGQLSGGERRRVALCRLLLSTPDLLLLDEPTNHLDAESVAWLERFLQEYAGTVVAITHDRYFLDNVAQWILEIDRGAGIPWEGNYSSWLDQKRARLAAQAKADAARMATLARELEWARMTPKARQAKGKARLRSYEQLLAEAAQTSRPTDRLEISIPPGDRLGDVVVEARNISKGRGDRLLFENLSFSLAPGAIVGVIGGNGAGKTTLLAMINGSESPDSGTLEIGKTVRIGYAEQGRSELQPNATVYDQVSGGQDTIQVGGRELHARAWLSAFGFRGADQQKLISQLSGGESNRAQLATVLRSGANLLLLDEPTNDLDVDTMRALEDALEAFPGCAVVVSHDRWFLDRVATHILAFEGDSEARFMEGNFSDYEADRRRRLGAEADRPHRMRYKPLARR